jgi:hypothetical protein
LIDFYLLPLIAFSGPSQSRQGKKTDVEKKMGGDGRDEEVTGEEGEAELTMEENNAVAIALTRERAACRFQLNL